VLIDVDEEIDLNPFRAKGKQETEELLPDKTEELTVAPDLGIGIEKGNIYLHQSNE
jgi:uncharacterized UBP type Zn finger protein